MTELMKGNN